MTTSSKVPESLNGPGRPVKILNERRSYRGLTQPIGFEDALVPSSEDARALYASGDISQATRLRIFNTLIYIESPQWTESEESIKAAFQDLAELAFRRTIVDCRDAIGHRFAGYEEIEEQLLSIEFIAHSVANHAKLFAPGGPLHAWLFEKRKMFGRKLIKPDAVDLNLSWNNRRDILRYMQKLEQLIMRHHGPAKGILTRLKSTKSGARRGQ